MNKKNLDSLPSSIKEAVNRIKDFTRVTPLEYSAYLSELSGAEVWLKLENFQVTGSFKARGRSEEQKTKYTSKKLKVKLF